MFPVHAPGHCMDQCMKQLPQQTIVPVVRCQLKYKLNTLNKHLQSSEAETKQVIHPADIKLLLHT